MVIQCPLWAAGQAWTPAMDPRRIFAAMLWTEPWSAPLLSINISFPQACFKITEDRVKAPRNATGDQVYASARACAGTSPCWPEQGPSASACPSSHPHFQCVKPSLSFQGTPATSSCREMKPFLELQRKSLKHVDWKISEIPLLHYQCLPTSTDQENTVFLYESFSFTPWGLINAAGIMVPLRHSQSA